MKGGNHPENKYRICHKAYCPLSETTKKIKFKRNLRCLYEC